MSAWLISDQSYANIKAHLRKIDEKMTEKQADKIVKLFRRANTHALWCRYGDTCPRFKIVPPVDISDVQFIKSIHCLGYQCSEGDTHIKFKKAFDLMDKYEGMAALKILGSMKEYQIARDAAAWE